MRGEGEAEDGGGRNLKRPSSLVQGTSSGQGSQRSTMLLAPGEGKV